MQKTWCQKRSGGFADRERFDLDLCNQTSAEDFLQVEKPDEVILAAAKAGEFMLIILTLRSLFTKPSDPKQCYTCRIYERGRKLLF